MGAGTELKRATRAPPGCVGQICFGSCVTQFYEAALVAAPQHLGLDGASDSSSVNVNKNLCSQRVGLLTGRVHLFLLPAAAFALCPKLPAFSLSPKASVVTVTAPDPRGPMQW